MKFLFSRFISSWTPYFLQNYGKKTTLGQSIGYYFFWCLIGLLGISIIVVSIFWVYSDPIDINPIILRTPPDFFLDIKKYFFVADWISFGSISINYPDISNFFYGPSPSDFTSVDANLFRTRLVEIYPTIRIFFLIGSFFLLILGGIIASLFFFLISFVWAGVVCVLSEILKKEKLSYGQSFCFSLHVSIPVIFFSTILTLFFGYQILWLFLLILIAYAVNLWGTSKA